jgi:predicted metal-dependent hydrolase
MYQYTLIRSRRKTVALYITRDLGVEVRAPLKMLKTDINRFVASKDQWIRTHLEKASERFAAKSFYTLSYDSEITLFGNEYPITAGQGRSIRFDGTRVFVPSGLNSSGIKRALVILYRAVANETLSERAGHFASLMGVVPAGIKINGAKTRWGSCSGKNSINFSWRIVMADEDVVDYVVVHELAHIKEHNHSPRFWSIVEGLIPDYKDKRRKLKLLQGKLAVEDWDV